MHQLTTRRRVEFSDTDMGGIVHFSRFFVFMETAEHELFRTLGVSVHFQHEGGTVGWPKVAATCEYRSPARYGDELEIELKIRNKGSKALTSGFTIRCQGRLVAEGRLTSVCCRLDGPEGVRAIPIPEFLAAQIEEAPE